MANSQLAEAAQKAIQDKQFNAWLKGIGEEGQKQIKKLFLETAEKDQKLKAMAQEDPQSTMILFAYQVYQQQSKQSQNSQEEPQQEEQNVEPEEEELEDMNNPPLTSPITAKFGAKLNHIIKLNGHCPEGYEIQYYSMGGHICGKCRKKKQLLMQSMSCGGKKRIKKNEEGNTIKTLKKPKTYGEQIYKDPYAPSQPKTLSKPKQIQNDRIKVNNIQQPNQANKKYPNIKKHEEGGELAYKKGGKTLTKAKANSLKYKGGPGDINSTEGMKPNKKQRRMLCKKIGGMVNNAKKITIYNQPDMFDVVH